MAEAFNLNIIKGESLSKRERAGVLALCSRAFNMNYEPLFNTFRAATHILARQDGALVGHALWVTRWLHSDALPLLRTAYVEAVAVEEAFRGRGIGTTVMQRLAQEIVDFDLGGLATGRPSFYARLGWETWRGPLSVRTADKVIPTPENGMMILRLPKTPQLDLDAPLSAEWREGELW
jgi:aminoglycoside 2'-N-acetyltransferase I